MARVTRLDQFRDQVLACGVSLLKALKTIINATMYRVLWQAPKVLDLLRNAHDENLRSVSTAQTSLEPKWGL